MTGAGPRSKGLSGTPISFTAAFDFFGVLFGLRSRLAGNS